MSDTINSRELSVKALTVPGFRHHWDPEHLEAALDHATSVIQDGLDLVRLEALQEMRYMGFVHPEDVSRMILSAAERATKQARLEALEEAAKEAEGWRKWYDEDLPFLKEIPDSWTAKVMRLMIPRIAQTIRELAANPDVSTPSPVGEQSKEKM
jgi:hypothetical protein